MNCDFTYIECFGYTSPAAKSWLSLIGNAFDKRDKQAVKDLEKSLKWNVESAYYRLVAAGVKDLDTDTEYFVSFVNGKKQWDIEIKDSKGAEVLPEDRDAFFKSDEFKRLLKQATNYLEEAASAYEGIVKQHIEAGELMDVDETKLEAIESMLEDGTLMKNLKSGKYIKQ